MISTLKSESFSLASLCCPPNWWCRHSRAFVSSSSPMWRISHSRQLVRNYRQINHFPTQVFALIWQLAKNKYVKNWLQNELFSCFLGVGFCATWVLRSGVTAPRPFFSPEGQPGNIWLWSMINDAEVLELCNCWIEFDFWIVFQVNPTPNRIRVLDCIAHNRRVVKNNGYLREPVKNVLADFFR